MLCNEPGVLPGSDYYFSTDEKINSAIHYHMILCGHYNCVKGYSIKRQFYEPLLAAYVLDGMLQLTYDGRDYMARPGEVVLLDCQKPHCYASGEHLEFLWAHFNGALSQQICNELNEQYGPVIRHDSTSAVQEELSFLISSYRNDQIPSPHQISAGLYRILCSLYSSGAGLERKNLSQPVIAAIEFMRYHIASPISIADIAATAHMSRHYFSRVFRQVTGYSPHDYLIKIRLDMAKHLLTTTDKTVREIAYAVGYRSEMGLTMAFTEKVGISPGRYRFYPK